MHIYCSLTISSIRLPPTYLQQHLNLTTYPNYQQYLLYPRYIHTKYSICCIHTYKDAYIQYIHTNTFLQTYIHTHTHTHTHAYIHSYILIQETVRGTAGVLKFRIYNDKIVEFMIYTCSRQLRRSSLL